METNEVDQFLSQLKHTEFPTVLEVFDIERQKMSLDDQSNIAKLSDLLDLVRASSPEHQLYVRASDRTDSLSFTSD